MLKLFKKLIPLLLVAALCVGVLAGCGTVYSASPLEGGLPQGEVTSNGGFVVQKGDYIYFINGSADYSADNTYGDVVKGSLMRITVSALESGDYSSAQTVVPLLVVSQDFTSGVYIYGDYVYYATPNTLGTMQGEVQSSYLDFKSTRLDGTGTMRHYYVQVTDNATVYRYVQAEDGTVYLVYVDSAETEIHSYNTATGTDTALVSGYSDYALNADDRTDPTIYYTMPVVKKNTYTASSGGEQYSYNQLYRVSAFATESPYDETDMTGYTDSSLDEGDENYRMEYVNLGTLVLDGVGNDRDAYTATPFNRDWTEEVRDQIVSSAGYSYDIVKYTAGGVVFTQTNLDQNQAFVYRLDDAAYTAVQGWNSITANPARGANASDGDAITPVSVTTTNPTESALFYTVEENGAEVLYYIYVSDGTITRVRVSETATAANDYIEESVDIAKQQTDASLLFLQDGYLYYSMAGTNGNALYRLRYDGTADQYNILEGDAYDNDDYKPTRYLEIDYNSSWYAPEIVAGNLFFCNAESYSENYVYTMANPANNADLVALNERYDDTQTLIDDIAENFSDASNLAQYYYYAENLDAVLDTEGDYYDQYEQEDLDLAQAFANCEDVSSRFHLNFTSLKEGETFYNVRSAFYTMLGTVAEADDETIQDALKTDLLLADDTATDDTGWTWQWAAIFVPVGVVVIAAAVVTAVLVRRRKRR